MTHVATFRDSSSYPNQRLVFENEAFVIEGSGSVDVGHVRSFDSNGDLEWTSAEMRAWAHERISAGSAPVVPSAPASTTPVQKPLYKRAWFILVIIIGALLLMCLMFSVVGLIGAGGSSSSEVDDAPDNPAATEPSEEAPEEPVTPAEDPVVEESEMSFNQKQAVSMVEDYLLPTSLSRQGFIDQLMDQGWDEADATFAVDYVDPDWNAQSVKRAQEIAASESFSRQGLIDQLVLDGFTPAQAEHGATAVGG